MHTIHAIPRPSPLPSRRSAVVPPQHGAWGFLLLPVALGITAGSWSWTSLPVILGWVCLYPFSWALTNRLAAPRPERFDRALQIWAVVAVPLLGASVVLHPWLLWVGSAYAIPFAANVAFASARRERSLANDGILIVECAAAVPVIAGLAAPLGSWSPPWSTILTQNVALMTATCALVLVGSTLHVRSLIRERSNPAASTRSRAFALSCVPLVLISTVLAGTGAWLVVPFGALALRAVFLHDPSWRPARIGMVELAGLVLVVVFSALAL